jgi:tetratricopeptide (TPR) repeat protein
MKNRLRELFEIADFENRDGNYAKAIATYQEILKLPGLHDKERHLSYWGIGEIYLNAAKYDDAEYYLSKAIEIAPHESYYQYLLGCTYTYKNQIEKAIHRLEQALAIDDSIEIYWGQLGWIVGHNKDFDKGVGYLKKALGINPKHYPCLRDLCMLYTQKHKFNEALVCIEEAAKYCPDNEEVQSLRSQVEFFQKEFEKPS